ncbi:peptidoglycan-binding domain-containing protein [Sediminimonas sp.]|uniref:peptidoglycan-binding domain-containing protein n=1 Tax=Sediminimonas sp. TaxID=2823379 RepID=UPI0025EA9137|nr:peptidoglycan-binding domain-containing protein [Sediminimonas sp.]
MKTRRFSLISAGAFALSLCLPSAAWSESLALILTNRSYDDFGRAWGVAERRALVEVFNDAGFRILGARDMSAAALRKAAVEAQDAAGRDGIDRVAIVLSGHFVAGANDSWLLGTDAADVSAITAGAEGLSVSALSGLASGHPGQALVVLIPSRGNDLPLGPGVKPGIDDFEIPQGVTFASGPSGAVQNWLGMSILTPGVSLSDAAQNAPDGMQVMGFLSDGVSFAGAAAAADPEQPAADVPRALAELSFWNAVRDIETRDAFERYLQRYPQGLFAADARAHIADIRDAPQQRARANEAALDLDRNARREVQRDLSLLGFDPRGIDGVFGPGSRAAIRAHQRSLGMPETGYLSAEQLRILRRDAARRADELEREAQERREAEEARDRAYWDSTGRGRDEAGLRAYLQRYPDGLFADLAQQRLSRIDDDRHREAEAEERNAWDRARARDTTTAYRRFLDGFPNGTFAEAARARLAQLEADDGNKKQIEAARTEEARVAGSQVARVLVEQRLSQIGLEPGIVDGSFDARTRRAIRRFQKAANLPVTGYVTQATMVRLLASGILRRN